MPIGRTTILDDRGRRVPLVEHEWQLPFGEEALRSARLREASRVAPPRPTAGEIRRGVVLGAVALPLLLASALLPAYLAFGIRAPWWVTILAALPMGALPALATVFIARRAASRRIARVYIRAGYCASCGYDLEAIPEESDGLRVCPECGAAWRTHGCVTA